MKLFKIKVTHYAPKDFHNAIKEYVVANDDREVFEYLANGYAWWKDILEDWEECWEYESLEEAKEAYEQIFNDKEDNREVDDLYYGATQYGWGEVIIENKNAINCGIKFMIDNGLAKDIRK